MTRTRFSPSLLAVFTFVGFCLPCMAQKAEPLPMPKEVAAVPPAPVNPLEEAIGKAKEAGDNAQKAADGAQKAADKAQTDATDGVKRGDTAWMLVSSAFVMLMVPGLALFYGGMVRKKNVLATMMQSYAALSIVGLYWIVMGYSLAFGPSIIKIADGGVLGWSSDLFFLKGIETSTVLPGYNIPVYVHVMFQGMFAIITPALISGALAERIRFWPFCIFMILWVTFVYCPLAHMVWAFDWFNAVPADAAKGLGGSAIGLLGKMGALDFAGGTVVHIAAGTAGLAAALVLRKRVGYPEHAMHPNSMVLTLIGAGLLWFGWFGFNGGSATNASSLAGSAFAATQAAAATAGLSWVLVEWLIKGKPTALGLASGIVAGLVAVTPASGFVYMWGGAVIGLIAGVVCYFAVSLKSKFGYDDSLDAFGVHAIGGFLGAVLTGVFCYAAIQSSSADGFFAVNGQKAKLADLHAQFPDAPDLAAIAELEAKVKELKGSVEKAQADKKADDEKSANAELTSVQADLKKALASLKKSDATKRFEELEALVKEKDAQLEALKKTRDDASSAFDSAADAAWLASEKGKGDAVETTKKAFETAKTEKEKTNEAYQKAASDLNELKVEQGKLKTAKDDLKALERSAAARWADGKGSLSQFGIQVKAALIATIFSFLASLVLAVLVQLGTGGNFTTTKKAESEGLDQTEHGEAGFDFGAAYDAVPTGTSTEPKAAKVPPGGKRFEVVVEGVENGSLMKAWSELCVPSDNPIDPDFKEVYPYVTTVQGNRFRFRGGDPAKLSVHIQKLFQKRLGKPLKVRVEE